MHIFREDGYMDAAADAGPGGGDSSIPFTPNKDSDLLLLAPMVGLSHRPLRTLAFGFGGLDFAFTEMASAGGYVSGAPFEEYWLDTMPRPAATGIQFYTIKPEHLEAACRRVSALPGALLPRAIDINFACSAPHIKRAGGGSDWMTRPEEAYNLVRLARASWPGLLTAKIRSGQDDDYGRLSEFCSGLAGAGLDLLSIHPRLDSQKFRRKARTDHIARLAAELSIPVVGNGDVRTVADWKAMKDACGPAGVMIGREAVRRPWIFALIRGAAREPGFTLEIDRFEVAERLLDLVAAELPPEWHVKAARAFFHYYSDNFSFAHHLKWKLVNAPDIASMRSLLAVYFGEVPQDRISVERG